MYSATNIAPCCQHDIYHRWYGTFAEFEREIIHISCISIIFDRYDNAQSIKQSERLRRGAELGPSYVIKGSRTVPNYHKFLLNAENKAALAAFVSEYIVSMGHSILDDQSIVLAGGFKEGEVVKKYMYHT